jgi:hypothetical protein
MLFVLILAAPALGQKKIEAGKVGAADVRMHIFPVLEGSGKSREERSKDL